MTAHPTTGSGARLVRWLAGGADIASSDTPSARAYLLNVGNGACTKLAEQVASPELVLPWLLGALGAPTGLAGLLVPVKQAGSLAPQLLMSGAIRRLAYRKWAWVAAGLVQTAALLAMIPAAWLSPAAAGWSVVGLLLIFSIASGCGSIAYQDVMGKTVAEGIRGRLLANRAAIGGALTLLAGAGMRAGLGDNVAVGSLLTLVGSAALLWATAALLFAGIPEPAGETGDGRSPLEEWRRGLRLLQDRPGFRRFLTTRALLLGVEVAAPFYALHAHGLVGGGIGDLGYYVLMVGLAGVVASPFWGALADDSARRAMIAAGAIGAASAALAITLPVVAAGPVLAWGYGAVFLTLGIAVAGVRLGRKTYLVDAAPEDERPLYVAFANTLVGLLALAAAGLGLVAEAMGVPATIVLLGVLAFIAAGASWMMPEASRMQDVG